MRAVSYQRFWVGLGCCLVLCGWACGCACTPAGAKTTVDIAIDIPRDRLATGKDCHHSDKGEVYLHDGVNPDDEASSPGRLTSPHTVIPPDFESPIGLPLAERLSDWKQENGSDCRNSPHAPLCWVKNFRTAQLVLSVSKDILYFLYNRTSGTTATFCTVLVKVDLPAAAFEKIARSDGPFSTADCNVRGPDKPSDGNPHICFPKPIGTSETWRDLLAQRQVLYAEADDVLAQAEQTYAEAMKRAR